MTNRRRTLKHLLLVAGTGLLIQACGSGEQVGDTKDSPVTVPFSPAPDDEWELVWSDEFDGETLNLNNWGYDIGDGSDRGLERWGNNEQQWYTDQNTTVSLRVDLEPGKPFSLHDQITQRQTFPPIAVVFF